MKKIFFLSPLCLLLTGCFKYDDGPRISLRSKTDRLANFWMTDKYFVDGIDSTAPYIDYTWRFGKDGSFDLYGTRNSIAWSRTGAWGFINAKTSVRLLNQASDSAYEFRITRLKEKQLWLEQKDVATSILREFRFIKKKE